jgi:hypothetical protein
MLRPTFSRGALGASCLAALGTFASIGGQGERDLELVAVEGRGDPNSLAWDREHGRVALGHGTRIEIRRDDEGGLEAAEPLASFDVDHTLMALELGGDALWIAAGTGGLVKVDAVFDDERRRTEVVQREARPCVALALGEATLWALFAGSNANRVLGFDPTTGKRFASVDLERGIGQDVLWDGRALWVSCGTAGLARVADPAAAEPAIEWWADPLADFPEFGEPRFPRRIGELARGAHHLFAAGDDLGVVRLPLDAEGRVRGEPMAMPMLLGGRITYASSLAADPERGWLAVGSNRAPRAAALGAPYGALGWLNHRFDLAGIDPADFEHGRGEGLSLFVEERDGLRLGVQSSQDAADWRGLELRGTVLFEQHTGRGARRTRLVPGELRRPPAVKPVGFAVVEVETSRIDPGRLRVGLDPAGSRSTGALRFTPEARIEVAESDPEPADFGLFVGEPWTDASGAEWFIAGGGLELKLWRRRANGELRAWTLELPADPRGRRGHTYFGAAKSGDLVAITRAQCDTGLLLVDAAALVARAQESAARDSFELPVLAALSTRTGREAFDGHGDPLDFVWSPSLARDRTGRLWCLLPAGVGHVERSEPARCLLFDLGAWRTGEVPEPIVVEAPRGPGHAVDAQLVLQGGRLFALVGDLVQGVHVFDLGDPAQPTWLATTAREPSAYDGRKPNLFDLEWRAEREELWVAYGRAGFAGYRGDRLADGLQPIRTVDTPGLALELAWRRVHGRDTLFVADQKGGLRVYR